MKNEKETKDDDRFEYAIEDLEDWERDFLDAFRRESEAALDVIEQGPDLRRPEFDARMEKLFRDHEIMERKKIRKENALHLQQQVGAALRGYRKLRGLTMEQVSKASGVSASHLGKIERGEMNATLGTLERIMASIKVDLAMLREGDRAWRSDTGGRRERVGAALRYFRSSHGLTMEQLAEASGVSVSHMSKIERGELNATLETLSRLMDILDFDLEIYSP